MIIFKFRKDILRANIGYENFRFKAASQEIEKNVMAERDSSGRYYEFIVTVGARSFKEGATVTWTKSQITIAQAEKVKVSDLLN